jgi:hypothetical protein
MKVNNILKVRFLYPYRNELTTLPECYDMDYKSERKQYQENAKPFPERHVFLDIHDQYNPNYYFDMVALLRSHRYKEVINVLFREANEGVPKKLSQFFRNICEKKITKNIGMAPFRQLLNLTKPEYIARAIATSEDHKKNKKINYYTKRFIPVGYVSSDACLLREAIWYYHMSTPLSGDHEKYHRLVMIFYDLERKKFIIQENMNQKKIYFDSFFDEEIENEIDYQTIPFRVAQQPELAPQFTRVFSDEIWEFPHTTTTRNNESRCIILELNCFLERYHFMAPLLYPDQSLKSLVHKMRRTFSEEDDEKK